MSSETLEHTLATWLQAGHRGIGVHTREERRALELVERVAGDHGLDVHTFSLATGVDGRPGSDSGLALMRRLLASDADEVWVLLDGDRWVRSDAERRALRELAQRERGPTCVVVASQGPADLDVPELRWMVVPLPDRALLRAHAAWVGRMLEQGGVAGASASFEVAADALATAGLGLERFAFEQLLAEAVAAHGPDPDTALAYLRDHKGARLDAAGLFEAVAPVRMDEVGGLAHYKRWLGRRRGALAPSARALAIPAPRGVLLVGVQGCGKSLAARATADALALPLFRVDPGRLFAGHVGESEANLRLLLATAERMAPVVLWLDEIDKSLLGTEGAQSDAGTASRVLAGLLTWLQEREAPVFVVATANRVDTLPPELLRRGRLDETFFVDLPDATTRGDILEIHLHRRPARHLGAAPPMDGDVAAYRDIAARARGFSGAELEAALVEARLDAFAEGRSLRPDDLERAVAATFPLSISRADAIRELRAWARSRARAAGSTEPS